MSSSRFITLVLLVPAFLGVRAQAEEWELCPGVRILAPDKFSLTMTETVLVCGDADVPAWKRVPRSQAVFHLKSFLQDRGYYHTILDESPDRVLVDVGDRTTVEDVVMEGSATAIDLSRFRGIKGEVLTPSLLQETEKRFLKELRSLGHACPKVSVQGFPDSGLVKIEVDAGPVGTISDVIIEPVESMNAAVLNRYHAFYPGAIYNERWLDLTTQRIHSLGVLQNTLFTASCDSTNVGILEKNVAGPPRLVSIGFGLNTEKGLAARATWKHVRVGSTASQAGVSLTGYYGGDRRNEQELAFTGLWYYQNRPSRFHVKPVASFRHESQQAYEVIAGKLQITPGVTWEGQDAGGSLYAGPALIGERTLRGVGRRQSAYLTLGADLSVMSHDFELFRTSPRSGYELTLNGSFSRKGWLGEITAQTMRASIHKLWNLGSFDPPLFVLGMRGSLSTTLTPAAEQTSLPPNLRHYLGGSLDLRGFGFQEIPNANGALTAFYLSTELRLGYWLPWGLQPLVFLDIGKTGSAPAKLDQPWLYSPGAGLRWESPIGAFRISAAHGIVGGTPPAGYTAKSHFQLFVSYGEEF